MKTSIGLKPITAFQQTGSLLQPPY